MSDFFSSLLARKDEEISDLRTKLTAAEARVKELEADKERLDWLEQNANFVQIRDGYWSIADRIAGCSLRQGVDVQIDLARKAPND